MPQPWRLSFQAAALASRGAAFTQRAPASAQTLLLVLHDALPFLLAAALLVERMFNMLRAIGDHMSGWVNIDDDTDDILLATVKAKRAKRRLKKLAEQKSATRPRKWLLLLPLIVLTLASCIDGLDVLLRFAMSTKATLATEEVWPIIVAICCYASYSVKCYLASEDAASKSMLLRIVCGISLVSNAINLVSNVALPAMTHHVGVCKSITIAISSLKFIASLALALAYMPRFAVPNPEKLVLSVPEGAAEDQHRPKQSASGTTEEDADEDDDNDGAEAKRHTPYDWPASALRLRRILPLTFPRHSRMAYVLIVACISLQIMMDLARVLQPRQFGMVVTDLAAGRDPWRNLFIWGLMRATMNHGGIVAVLRVSLWKPISSHVGRNMEVFTFSHVLGLGMKYHSNKSTGAVISALSRGDSVTEVLDVALFYIFPMIFDMTGSMIVLASQFGPGILGIVAATGVGYVGILNTSRKRSAELRAEYLDRSDNKATIKNESITNVELVKYLGTEPYEVNRCFKSLLRMQKADWEYDIYRSTVSLLEEAIQVAGTVAGALLIANQILSEKLDIGLFVMFITYINAILGNLESLRWITQWMNRLLTDTDKLMVILEENNDIVDSLDAEELLDCKGHIEFRNVTFMYDESKGNKGNKEPRKALDSVSFTVEPGQHVALVGETGAGKSTTFKLLYRFYEPQHGSIRVEGKDIKEYTQRSLRQALGVVQQEGQVFNDSIFANIKYGDIAAPDERVMAAAKVAQIHDKIVEWPEGYQTVVGERGMKLSGGEKQRINIARTVLKNPKVLLLDEAPSALDSNTEKAIQGQLRELTRGKTTIAIAHRLSTIAHADKIIVLDKGRVVESGTHEDLVKIEGGFYKKLWDTQTSTGKPALDEDSSLERQGEILEL